MDSFTYLVYHDLSPCQPGGAEERDLFSLHHTAVLKDETRPSMRPSVRNWGADKVSEALLIWREACLFFFWGGGGGRERVLNSAGEVHNVTQPTISSAVLMTMGRGSIAICTYIQRVAACRCRSLNASR